MLTCNLLYSLSVPHKIHMTECSETSAYKIQTPGNHPEESIQHSGQGENLKSRITFNLISGFRRALLQSITFISRLTALSYTKLRG